MMTGVTFSCDDPCLQQLYETAEMKMEGNIRDFSGRKVLVEGAGYEKIWLETQPMGGEMNCFRHPESAKNNILLFMENIRDDGRMPGSIQCSEGKIIPQYDKLQGFCFPRPALRMYDFLLEEDKACGTNKAFEYLENLRFCLEKFENWLQKTRDLWNTGILASFCVYDTGEDNAVRYGDAPCYCTADEPPSGYDAVPMMSMDVTGYACACRDTLAAIARKTGDEEREKYWTNRRNETREAIVRHLWDERKKACFDRYRDGRINPVLCHNTLRCMYFNALPEKESQQFIDHHLKNKNEFDTFCPVPSVSVSDPLFSNAGGNNWSGQSQALTWQRLLDTDAFFNNYPDIVRLSGVIFNTIRRNNRCFYQQYDPFTGIRGSDTDGYGPAIISTLRAFDLTMGVCIRDGQVIFSTVKGLPFEYKLTTPLHSYFLKCDGASAEALIDGRMRAKFSAGERKRLGKDDLPPAFQKV